MLAHLFRARATRNKQCIDLPTNSPRGDVTNQSDTGIGNYCAGSEHARYLEAISRRPLRITIAQQFRRSREHLKWRDYVKNLWARRGDDNYTSSSPYNWSRMYQHPTHTRIV